MNDGDGSNEVTFNEYFEKRAKQKALDEPAVPAPESEAAVDGRVSNKQDKFGRVQVNMRMPFEVKALIYRERERRRKASLPNADMHAIVVEAVRAYLEKA